MHTRAAPRKLAYNLLRTAGSCGITAARSLLLT